METRTFVNNPSVDMRGPHGYVEGILHEMGREVTTNKEKGWKKFVYVIKISDTDFPTTIREGSDYKDVPVEEGALIDLWATPGLHKKLSMFDTGIKVRVTKIDLGGKKGSPYEVAMVKAAKGGGK